MSEVQVCKIQPEAESVLLLTQQVDALYEEIERRAFAKYESRGGSHGFDREDWLAAESSLVFAPPVELLEDSAQFVIRAAIPGFDPGQVRVSVLPRAVILSGESVPSADSAERTVRFSEFTDRRLLRRIDLPQEVRPYTTRAALVNGILQISLRKAAVANERLELTVAASA